MTEMPATMRARIPQGGTRPIPFFVTVIDGKPDFRLVDPLAFHQCVNLKLCWICGQPLGEGLAFVGGPLCAINRVTAEPASHPECADYAARVCPFMVNPSASMRDTNLPEHVEIPGVETGNPGLTAIILTRRYTALKVELRTYFRANRPTAIRWFREGREATRSEVQDAVAAAYHRLLALRPTDEGTRRELARRLDDLGQYIPAA